MRYLRTILGACAVLVSGCGGQAAVARAPTVQASRQVDVNPWFRPAYVGTLLGERLDAIEAEVRECVASGELSPEALEVFLSERVAVREDLARYATDAYVEDAERARLRSRVEYLSRIEPGWMLTPSAVGGGPHEASLPAYRSPQPHYYAWQHDWDWGL